jgi:biotin transport system substrate-specific component
MSATALTPHPVPLIDRLVPVPNAALRRALQVALGVALLALLAQVRIVVGPVPHTGQTFAVLLLAAAFGARLGVASVVAYLLVGAAGVGVFSGGAGGLAVLTGTTAGYLVGFVVAAAVVGSLAERGWDRSFAGMTAAMGVGTVLIYVFGVVWLAMRFAPDLPTALAWGVWPFVVGDVLKLLLAAALVPTAWRFLAR